MVCAYCSSTLYREDEVLRAGEKSIVGEPRSNLVVGARGRVGRLELEIVGRVRFDHGSGAWDEWYAIDSGGRDHWIVEDERSYALERPAGIPDLQLGDAAVPALGAIVRHMGTEFQVDEVGEATCVGGEGSLPRHIAPGETYRFVDLTAVGDDAILAIELCDPPQAYLGRAVPASEVDFPPREAPVAGHPSAGEVVQAKSVQCASCGATVPVATQEKPVLTAGCATCGAVLHLDEAEVRVVGTPDTKVGFPFAVGDRARLLDGHYEVMGRLHYVEMDGSRTREYLLWSEEDGYLWLEEYDRHYHVYRPTQKGPRLATLRMAGPGSKVDCGEGTYRFFESGIMRLTYVDGALPWLAELGDTQDYYTLIDPPRVYSVEITENREMERFTGTWIPPKEVFEAFGKSTRYDAPDGVGAGQPNPVGPTGTWSMRMFFAFAALNFFLACGTFGSGTPVLQANLVAEELQGQVAGARIVGEWVSEPFRVPANARVLGMHYDTNVSNDWASVAAELLVDDVAVGALESDIEYYSGRDSEGSWSEGSRSGSAYAVAPPPGEYRVRVSMDANRRTRVSVKVTVGDTLTRWPMLAGIGMGLLGFFILLRRQIFEQRRRGEDLMDD